MGGDYFALCLAIEELARVDQSVAITLEAGCSLGRDAGLPVRHRGAEAALAAGLLRGRIIGRLRPDRAGGRQRRRRHPHHRRARRRRLGDQRQQGFHHQQRHRHHPARHRHRAHRRRLRRALRRVRSARSGARADTGLHRRARLQQGRLARVGHPPAHAARRAVPEENLLGERGRGYANFLHILDEGRIAIAALPSAPRKVASTRACGMPRSAGLRPHDR